ncbi:MULTISPECIES: competence type IV pilus ATPase ComGA [unclassified Enterococcus]|uniref:competence type IV pilus ATPase ComGA n=1 Tax=unclassified Enterococcus TaxID=2608891 RepID=UPI001551DA65|nr:Flp pilus assembly complex ATPase component TadA [Enterococcus sp. MMGLQ5-2]MBS7584641.1 Flp pilus assembly complex ATPase component TadA [Enterococcus sp. MMGLQ5-1]NPD12496.1 Flp pilus assembly complex ATPase component TadA [Enterococcus sp. MMGLQ5-1]NPD37100.1 Flp pilus assembly complex ATPase component TadA [Enterococcus sp. MMGLQ5-2]
MYILPNNQHYQVIFREGASTRLYQSIDEKLGYRLITHIKYLANMNVGENRRIQLGGLNYTYEQQLFRLRISTVGDYQKRESMVVRILHDFQARELHFLLAEQQQQSIQLIQERGLYLFCGPVGSGKTTLMHYLVSKKFKGQQIISIEDPVEIENTEILQLQINEAIGLDYESLIKLSLRHRPDLLMIGEIRDLKTAKAVFQAALAGHTVFSSIHAKSPASILSRLIELGIPKSDIEHALKGTIYQRLLASKNEIGLCLQIDSNIIVSNQQWNQNLEKLVKMGVINASQTQKEYFKC